MLGKQDRLYLRDVKVRLSNLYPELQIFYEFKDFISSHSISQSSNDVHRQAFRLWHKKAVAKVKQFFSTGATAELYLENCRGTPMACLGR